MLNTKILHFTFYIMILRPTALQVDRPLLKQQYIQHKSYITQVSIQKILIICIQHKLNTNNESIVREIKKSITTSKFTLT